MSQNPLKGSERQPVSGAKSVGKSDPKERLEVTVIVRRRAADDLQKKVKELVKGGRSHISRDEFAKTYGAAPADFAAVKKFAEKHGLAVVQEDAPRRSVVLSGTVAHFNDAFCVDLQQFEYDGGSYRGRTGAVHLAPALKGIVEGIFGRAADTAMSIGRRSRVPSIRTRSHRSTTIRTETAKANASP